MITFPLCIPVYYINFKTEDDLHIFIIILTYLLQILELNIFDFLKQNHKEFYLKKPVFQLILLTKPILFFQYGKFDIKVLAFKIYNWLSEL